MSVTMLVLLFIYDALVSAFQEVRTMAPEKGPNRLNMKFTKSGTRLVIHLVRGLPPKLSRDKKTITITFPEDSRVRTQGAKL